MPSCQKYYNCLLIGLLDFSFILFHSLSTYRLSSTLHCQSFSCLVESNSLWPMDCSPTGSSVHVIHQARIPEWVAISFSRGSSPPRDRTWISCITGRPFTIWASKEDVLPEGCCETCHLSPLKALQWLLCLQSKSQSLYNVQDFKWSDFPNTLQILFFYYFSLTSSNLTGFDVPRLTRQVSIFALSLPTAYRHWVEVCYIPLPSRNFHKWQLGMTVLIHLLKMAWPGGFPGGSVIKNPPANAKDIVFFFFN